MKTVKQMIEGWKADIAFAGWTDTVGMTIRMMQGNTVKFKVHGSHIALEGEKSWESIVTDHMELSFGEGRQVYRSLCAILTTVKI